MRKAPGYVTSLKLLTIVFLFLNGATLSTDVFAGTKKIGEACHNGATPSECIDGAICDDSYCTCGESGGSSASCATTYGNSSADADKWSCLNERKDPDTKREEWNFCKKNTYFSNLPMNSTEDVKYPVESKALLGFPCGDDEDGCWDPEGSAGRCQQTTLLSAQSPTDPLYDPWYTSGGKKLQICGVVKTTLAVALQCEHQYGPGPWTAVEGTGELVGINTCKKDGGVVMSSLSQMRKNIAPINDGTGAGGVNTTFLGIGISTREVELKQPEPKIGIPGVVFSKINKNSSITTDEQGAAWLNIPFLGEYIAAIYRYSVMLISFIAILVLIISGIQIITSAGNSEAISSAKHRIVSSVIAIVLTAGSYTILYTINPELVNLRNLKILVVPGKEFDFTPEADDIPSAVEAVGLDSVVALPGANPSIPTNILPSVNPIPYLIGPLPDSFGTCSQEAFAYTAQKLSEQNVCVGSCHCAYTASHFLNYIKCTITYSGGAPELSTNAATAGWTRVNITKENEKTLPLGLAVLEDSDVKPPTSPIVHVGISLGGGKLFDSSDNTAVFNKVNKATGNTCPPINPTTKAPLIFDIDPNDNSKNCSGCSRIPSEAPATGRFAAKFFTNPGGTYEGSLVKGTNSGRMCKGIQFWGIRPLTKAWGWDYIYVPPSVMQP